MDACHYCDRPAEYLCDFVLFWGARPKVPWREGMTGDEMVASLCDPGEAAMKTCDRRLCENHRVNKGHTFYCGKAGEVVSEDFCPAHAKTGLRGKPAFNPIGGPRRA